MEQARHSTQSDLFKMRATLRTNSVSSFLTSAERHSFENVAAPRRGTVQRHRGYAISSLA